MTAVTLALLLLPVIALAIFWKYSIEQNRQSLERLSISISLCLFAIVYIYWTSTSIPTGSVEGVRLGFGSSFVVLVRLIIKSLPTTAPEVVRSLGLEEKPLRKPQALLASLQVFIFVVLGYLCITVFFIPDPKIFLDNIGNQWWIILVALFIAAVRYHYLNRETA